MKERIFNIYIEVNCEIITKFRVQTYSIDGNDDEKKKFLQSRVEIDYSNAEEFPIPDRYILHINGIAHKGVLRHDRFLSLSQMGKHYEIISEILQKYTDIKVDAFMCFTMVRNGEIIVNGEFSTEENQANIKEIHFTEPIDYLTKHMINDQFHVCDLIDDDFFKPIKILSNNSYYANATKLLLSAIDTFSFLELGDCSGNFPTWVNKYMDINSLHITAEELWELRNSILHMTNYESRKVKKGSTLSLTIVSGGFPMDMNAIMKTINFHDLYVKTAEAVQIWLTEVFSDNNRELTFFQRYDSIISDARMGYIQIK